MNYGNEEKSPAVTLRSVPLAEKATLFALMQPYLHDSSEYTGDDVNDQGIYPYYYFDLYWTEDGRFPFLIMLGNQIVGLALVRQLEFGEDPLHQLAEFFILRKYRRRGIGGAAARVVFDRFPGRWEVQEDSGNIAGQAFWRRVIDNYTKGDYQEQWDHPEHHNGPVQTFRSPHSPRE